MRNIMHFRDAVSEAEEKNKALGGKPMPHEDALALKNKIRLTSVLALKVYLDLLALKKPSVEQANHMEIYEDTMEKAKKVLPAIKVAKTAH
ncbi:Uncharacterised protein [Candidatus Norongarragalina meridionalis]|nr:Uncharacterised protein [Candidatus Norongarragalina meridionalis]